MIISGVITGTVKPILGRESKEQLLTHYCTEHALAASDAAAIGDGNDMAHSGSWDGSGLYRQGCASGNHRSSTEPYRPDRSLFLQGYRKADFVINEAG